MAGFNPKDYVDVQTRILQFWKDHPQGAIRTRLMSDPSDFTTCRYVAEVFKEAANESPDATGYAFEIAGTGMANKTSHEENCETSAIGRALANMGYATSGKDRPSREEMSKASAPARPTPINAGDDKPITAAAMKRIHALLAEQNLGHEYLTVWAIDHGHESSKQLTMGQVTKLGNGLKEKPEAVVKYLDQIKSNQESGKIADAQKAGN